MFCLTHPLPTSVVSFFSLKAMTAKLAEAAIYTLPSIQGNFLMLPNTDDEESEINLELLFGAALTDISSQNGAH